MKQKLGVGAILMAVLTWYACGLAALMMPASHAAAQPSAAKTAAPAEPPAAATAQPAPAGELPAPATALPAPAAEHEAEPGRPAPEEERLPSRRGDQPPAVAIIVPVALFLSVVVIVVGGMYAAYRRDRQRHDTLRLVIERGGALPPELLVPPARRANDLRRGVVLVSTGIGLIIVLAAVADERGVWTAGLIPTLIGAGYLLVWKLERPRSKAEAGGESPGELGA